MADYSEAILRDSSLVPAYVNRGLALLELKQYAAALADFETAATPDRHDPSIEAGRGMAMRGWGAVRKPIPRFNLLSPMPRPWMNR